MRRKPLIRAARAVLASAAILVATSVTASAGEIVATVRNAQTEEPVQGANVRILALDARAVSDRHGHAAFPDLDGGVYRIYATHVAFEPSDTLLVDAAAARDVEIRLVPRSWVVDEVVVTGTRSPHLLKEVPVQTEVIGHGDFRRTGARTADEALARSVGATVRRDLSGEGVALRGLDGNRVLVLVDGERAVGRVRGSIDLSQYSLLDVDHIEVVKGSGSTLYGSEAIGGVVNIITHDLEKEPAAARLYLDYGSHGTVNPSVDLTRRFGSTAVSAGARYHRTSGFDLDPSTPHTNGAEAIDRLNVNLKASSKLSPRWGLSGSGRFMAEARDWVESEVFPPDLLFVYDDEETNRRYEASSTLDFRSGERYRMALRLFGTYYDHRWVKNAADGGARIDVSETDDEFYEASYASNFVIGEGHQATYGLDANYQDLRSSELAGGAKADRAWDAYLQYEYSPLRSVSFLPGVRYERHTSFGEHVNPSLNVMVVPGSRVKLRGSVSRGFRAPSIKEQYFIFDHTAAGYVVYGGSVTLPGELSNDSFEPLRQETSINSSVSAEFSYGAIGMHRLTLFYNHLDDLIDFRLIGLTPTYWRGIYVYQNIGTAITRGLEWESRIKLTHAFDLSFSYDYLYSRDLDVGRPLLNRPEHTVKLVVSALDEGSGFGGSLWGDYTSEKLWVSLSNTGQQEGSPTNAPERLTMNVNGFKRFSRGLEAFVRVENLLDRTNMTYGYWPGRQVFVGMRYEWNAANP